MKKSAVLWTGGKDCALAFFLAIKKEIKITHLVTFVPEAPDFKAHNLEIMRKQVKSIGLPHLLLTVKPPMKESYENAITLLKTKHNIDLLVTGDIDEIENHSNWIEECSKKSKMKIYNPLWKKNRAELLQQLIANNFEVIFSLIKKPFFNKSWIATKLNSTVISKLKELNIDICGENGEYHTMVLDAPFFNQKIVLDKFDVIEQENFYYLKIN